VHHFLVLASASAGPFEPRVERLLADPACPTAAFVTQTHVHWRASVPWPGSRSSSNRRSTRDC